MVPFLTGNPVSQSKKSGNFIKDLIVKPSEYIQAVSDQHIALLAGHEDLIDRIYARQVAMVKLLDFLFMQYINIPELIQKFYVDGNSK